MITHPIAYEIITQNTYVDDSLFSVNTEEEAEKAYMELKKVWSKCNMEAKKWISNSKLLKKLIPEEDRANSYKIEFDGVIETKSLM